MAHLTEHFTEEELGVDFASPEVKKNALYLCTELLEPIRAHYAAPLDIHDGYRDSSHNKVIGGKPTSFHLGEGGKMAADFHVVGVGLAQTFDWIRGASGLAFDKVILEHDTNDVPRCVHIQLDRFKAPRRQAFIGSTGNGTVYTPVEVSPFYPVCDPEISV